MNNKEQNKITNITLIIFISIILLLGAGIGAYNVGKIQNKLKQYKQVTATVIELKLTKNENNHKYYHPVFKYTVNGKEYRYDYFDGNYAYKAENEYNINDTMILYYNSDEPKEVITDTSINTYAFMMILCGFFAIIFIITAIIDIKKYNEIYGEKTKG